MHFVRVVTCFVLITFFSSSSITTSPLIVKSKKLTVLGTLTEEMDADANPACDNNRPEYDEILQKANMVPRVRPCISFEWSPVLS